MRIDELAPAELGFIRQLGQALARSPQAALDLALVAPEDPALITTAVVEGRFKSLSLRAIGPRLRWERPVGPLSLGVPDVEELDVHGLELTELRVGPSLKRLDCSNNALRNLDLDKTTRIEVLDVSANDLMVLDLRDHHLLTNIDCSGNSLSALVLSDMAPVKTVDAARNQLMVFDIGPRPHLTELRLDRNALVHLPLDAPKLRVLSVSHNQLPTLELAGVSGLQSLDVSWNRLGSLATACTPHLRALFCRHNYLDGLGTEALVELEELSATGNQIQRITLHGAGLHRLELAENRLVSLRLGQCPCLEYLDVSDNELDSLDLGGAPSLMHLVARHNGLTTFDVDDTPDLTALDLVGNPLERVQLSHTLAQVELDGSPVLVAPETLVRQLPALRRVAGHPVHEEPAEMDRFELHHLAATYEGADRDLVLLTIAEDTERCARGTAALIYWATHPHYYLQFSERDEVPSYAQAGWDLLTIIEAQLRADAYAHDDVPFDPRNDPTRDPTGRNWTVPPASAQLPKRTIPAFMARRCG